MATRSTAPAASYQIAPLGPDVPFGAIVSGLTLTDLDDTTVRSSLLDLWIDRGVLLFRGEDTPEMHVSLSECFGQLERHVFPETWVDGRPALVKVKYYPDDGSIYEIDGELRGGWLLWHSDLVYTDTINRGGILRPVQLPASLGLTGLIDQIAAYDRLPEALKARIEGLHVVYTMDLNSANHKFGRPAQIRFVRGAKSFGKIMRREYEYPRILHPMVSPTGARLDRLRLLQVEMPARAADGLRRAANAPAPDHRPRLRFADLSSIIVSVRAPSLRSGIDPPGSSQPPFHQSLSMAHLCWRPA